jgi:large subunit ribosomal protein L7/L12
MVEKKEEIPKEKKEEIKEIKEPAAKEAKPKAPKEEKEAKTVSKAKLSQKAEEIIKSIETLSVLELADLVKALEEKFGVSAMAPVAVAAPGAAAAAPAEEKSSFDVVLKEVGSQKIQVIKVVRTLTDLGLKEAKALVDGAPKPVKTGVAKDEADGMKKKLEEVGATVEIK